MNLLIIHNFTYRTHTYVQSHAKNSTHPIFFLFALKTVKSGVLEMKDVLPRALILNTTSLYGVNFESVSGTFQKSQKHKPDNLDYSQQKWYCLQNSCTQWCVGQLHCFTVQYITQPAHRSLFFLVSLLVHIILSVSVTCKNQLPTAALH